MKGNETQQQGEFMPLDWGWHEQIVIFPPD